MLQTHRKVREISRGTGIRLRCYEITTMSLVVAFIGSWNTVITKNATNLNIDKCLEVMRQHIVGDRCGG